MKKLFIVFVLHLIIFQFSLVESANNSKEVDEKDPNRSFFYANGGQPNDVLYYDYVILGAGTAGSVVASKLAENPDINVLLVEEGPFALHPNIWNTDNWVQNWIINPDPVISKKFDILPQPSLNDRPAEILRAKVVGGCNAHNGMVVMGGSKQNYEDWANVTENPLLNWAHAKEALEDVMVHYNFYRLPQNRVMFPEMKDALKSLGYTYNPEPLRNGKQRGSYGDRVYMMRFDPVTNTTRRETSFSQYVQKDIDKKRNLDVMVNEKAIKLNIGKVKGKLKAKGVLLSNVGIKKTKYINVAKEIIISMGSIETVKFLQLNGIGDREYLESIGIKSVVDSPGVGVGLMEDMYTQYRGRPLSDKYKSTYIPQRVSLYDGLHVYGPVVSGKFTYSTSCDYIMNFDITNDGFKCDVESSQLGSEGYVRVTSNDHTLDPEIFYDPGEKQSDLQTYAGAIRDCRKMENYLVKAGVLSNTTCGSSIPSDTESMDDYIEYLKKTVSLDSHPCCTVRMGAKMNTMAPLDGKFRVKGVKNLRVVDLSALPSQVSGNPNIPLVVIATQAVKTILQDE
ncbi:hypothetical protein CYY_003916 [Polysphondylium violaceum]|uniref:Glucose-methanol-choline oxidoreductase N-terminal domain-containing protein n=1 Tax=Polysphondylium violaceum TaxID=133409 RepID=A0A8J4PW20_9MYCE|nr:hypothetical protein CYY_003916 [Polysphondylium violaceum]